MDAPPVGIGPDQPEAYFNRELSWLAFAARVLALVEDPELPLLERVKFAGIMGMLHDEFFMKRVSGLKKLVQKGSRRRSLDGRTPEEELAACRDEILRQTATLDLRVLDELRPALEDAGIPLYDHDALDASAREHVRRYFVASVMPILTPLAVDAEHPFPFISNLGLNLAVQLPEPGTARTRFVRVKVPNNRPRFIPLPRAGFVPLEQVIAANLDLVFPSHPPESVHLFRVTRGAEGERDGRADVGLDDDLLEPGRIVRLVADDLKARKFAGVVRLQVEPGMPQALADWLCAQLRVGPQDVFVQRHFLGLSDLLQLDVSDRPDLHLPPHRPVAHPRLAELATASPEAFFDEIRRGDVFLHHPYQSFDSSVLRFLESAAVDPDVLAIKLTIYRTSKDSPIVRALAEAARRGKQVAVLVEITARFDEAPNIAWGQFLENEGVHVAYGVERLKTHVKAALVIREEGGELRRYAHLGTGNYHTGTARLYEDVGVLTCEPEVCDDVARIFNELTGASSTAAYRRLLVAPTFMRDAFVSRMRREAEHARAGRPSGIFAKLNQLQDREVMRELYATSRAGVPIDLVVRGLCCLRPGVPGLSETVRVWSVVGRFLEHSRIYRFENGGDPEYLIGSADWMKRNLENRVETIVPLADPEVRREVEAIIETYRRDNASAWDCRPDGSYVRRRPAAGETRIAVQDALAARARDRRSAGPGIPIPAV
ncbi:MAG TPA: polyphosphate kinase 1 [Candidatus Polarisedimenticolaceae bacterium]